ncbi:hypothetical protein HYDPIDRAFT_116330 [Hydnomerulius pinastri MD-312]|uniref:Uncharacterized protein n=1 Tax=Hydnomerulius pinastri MD-312 TaxID=994086 RepID=A0A0C9V643_9AGAM|nr:hypothetical protein HYDPIDRAFT_116330 [Hydnomerulius pinastri MD-312]
MDIWKQEEKGLLERNNARRIAFRKAMSLWTEECAQAKDEGRRPGWARPKLRKLESPIPNPVVDSPEGEEAGRNGDENEDENKTILGTMMACRVMGVWRSRQRDNGKISG